MTTIDYSLLLRMAINDSVAVASLLSLGSALPDYRHVIYVLIDCIYSHPNLYHPLPFTPDRNLIYATKKRPTGLTVSYTSRLVQS